VLAAFGFNESFRGLELVEEFKAKLRLGMEQFRSSAFDGSAGPRLALLGPPANENLPLILAAIFE
jgi:hypothetical protein